MTPTLVFDIETIPDVDGTAPPASLAGDARPTPTCSTWALQQRRAATGGDFLPLYLQRVVAIACAMREGNTFRVWSLGRVDRPRTRADPSLLRRDRSLHAATGVVERRRLRSAGAQSSRDDPRRHRGEVLGLGRRRPRIQVQQLSRPLSHAASRSDGRAGDVSAARSAGLDAMARLCGFPGKLGIDGSQVHAAFAAGKIDEITALLRNRRDEHVPALPAVSAAARHAVRRRICDRSLAGARENRSRPGCRTGRNSSRRGTPTRT